MDTLILVNKQDQIIGLADKLTTHKLGLLHRAFSIVILRKQAETIQVLLQQRSLNKYHGGGLWTNTCCSHFVPETEPNMRLQQRLKYEMGLSADLQYAGSFIYKARLGELIEHELDHVYCAFLENSEPTPNKNEVMATKWVDFKQLINEQPNLPTYSPWLSPVLALIQAKINSNCGA